MLGTRQRSVRACGALAPATPVLGAPQARRSLSPRPFAQRAVAVVVEHKPRWTSRIAVCGTGSLCGDEGAQGRGRRAPQARASSSYSLAMFAARPKGARR